MSGRSELDRFEAVYRSKFSALLAPHGIAIHYEEDRAGIDVGLHPTEPSGVGQMSPLGTTRIWFQLKGKREATVDAATLANAESIGFELNLQQVRSWYAASEPVYLVAYLEASDSFIADDVREIIDRKWGESFLNGATFKPGQESVTLRVPVNAVFDDRRVAHLVSHRSMRIDGPAFRGRPLGHRLDPLRSETYPLEPSVFTELVFRLLEVHGFEEDERLSPELVGLDGADHATFAVGRLFSTYEFIQALFTEYGVSDASGYRVESRPEFVQGPVAVLIHPVLAHDLQRNSSVVDDLGARGCSRLLVFHNSEWNAGYFGAVRGVVAPLSCLPQGLESLAFNILTTTNVFLEFRHHLRWKIANYL